MLFHARAHRAVSTAAVAAVGLFGIQSIASAAILYNPVVTQVGDGVAAVSGQGKTSTIEIFNNSQANQSTPVSQLAYNNGSGVGSMLVNSGTAGTEGLLSNNPATADAAAAGLAYTGTTYVFSAGYNTPNNTAGVKGTGTGATATGPDRAVGYMNATGSTLSSATVAYTQSVTTTYDSNNIRGAVGDDSATNFWSSGVSTTTGTAGLGGWRYFNTNPSTRVTTSASNDVHAVELRNGKMFGSTADSTAIYEIGASPVTTSGNIATKMITTASGSSPDQFVLINDPTRTVDMTNSFGYDTCYIADDSKTTKGGGIQKWTYDGTAWSLAYTMNDGTSGAFGLAGQLDLSTNKVVLWATSADGLRLEQITDNGSAALSPFTTLATAPANDTFRGVALTAVPEPASISLISLASVAMIRRKR